MKAPLVVGQTSGSWPNYTSGWCPEASLYRRGTPRSWLSEESQAVSTLSAGAAAPQIDVPSTNILGGAARQAQRWNSVQWGDPGLNGLIARKSEVFVLTWNPLSSRSFSYHRYGVRKVRGKNALWFSRNIKNIVTAYQPCSVMQKANEWAMSVVKHNSCFYLFCDTMEFKTLCLERANKTHSY